MQAEKGSLVITHLNETATSLNSYLFLLFTFRTASSFRRMIRSQMTTSFFVCRTNEYVSPNLSFGGTYPISTGVFCAKIDKQLFGVPMKEGAEI